MKRILHSITFFLAISLLLPLSGAAQFVLQKSGGAEAVAEFAKDGEGEWIYWDSGLNEGNGIGTGQAAVFAVASRWVPADLAEYDGLGITEIRFFPRVSGATYTLKVWTAAPGGAPTEVYSQAVTSFTNLAWNEVALTTPWIIDASEELWFGYSVDTPSGHPAGCDQGPHVPGKGNMIYFNNAWAELTALNADLTFNWNLGAYVEPVTPSNTVVDIIVGSDDHTTLAAAVVAADLVGALSGAGPFTVFAPTDAAFDALPAGLLDDLLADPSGDLTKILLYHVVAGKTMSTDLANGQEITTLLGQDITITINNDGVFINGDVEITVVDLEADNGVVHVIDAVLVPDLSIQSFSITFNVDMTDVEGFDPETHEVWVTGTFAGWSEPGTEGSYQMSLIIPDTKEATVILEEGFEGTTFPPAGWLNVDNDGDGQVWFSYAADNSAHTGTRSAASASWTASTGPLNPDNWLITPQLSIANDAFVLEYYVGAQDPDWPEEKYGVFISTTGTNVADFTEVFVETLQDGDWYKREISLTPYANQSIYIAFRHFGVTDMFYMKIDDVKVYSEAPIVLPDELIYTVTVAEVVEGQVEYKYFSDAFGAGWAGGEWAGGANRIFQLNGDAVRDDVWGVNNTLSVPQVELAEEGILLFPNPVRTILNINSADMIQQVRIFDLTGRMVVSQPVNGNTASVNVSEFRQGVYVMQVMTANGIGSKKFTVVK